MKLTVHSMLALGVVACWSPVQGAEPTGTEQVEVRVGQDEGDIRGSDNRGIQAAIDYAANLGGGTVRVGPGTFTLRSSITLRNGVRLVGTAGKTVLSPVDGVRSALATDGDANQREITLADPSAFRVGDRILITDDRNASAFRVTSAVLTARIGRATFRLSEPLRDDCMVQRHAAVELSFPAVGGWGIHNAVVEGIIIEGNRRRTKCVAMDGCRHGGIYLFECQDIAIRNCVVRDFNGDGISFQMSSGVSVEDCLCEKNAGHGIHPGSGSQKPVICRNRSLNNDRDGLFVCWRVQEGKFESNTIRDNGGVGISIGHKDSDNRFVENRIESNRGAGLFFREETEPMGAHRNVFEKNVFLDNGASDGCIVIRGVHNDLTFRGNTIGYSKAPSAAGPAILADGISLRLSAKDNHLQHVTREVEVRKTKP
jgi:parallel beta-helix repeat protein